MGICVRYNVYENAASFVPITLSLISQLNFGFSCTRLVKKHMNANEKHRTRLCLKSGEKETPFRGTAVICKMANDRAENNSENIKILFELYLIVKIPTAPISQTNK